VGGLGSSHNTEVFAEDWSSEEQNIDHLVSGGTAHFLDHIDSDLKGFHKLEERMSYLKEVMTEHAQRKVVGNEELDNANFLIQELEEQVMKPFEEHLTALKAELMKPHEKYDEETILEISNLILTSEIFLKTAQEKVEIVEVMEEVWEVMEEEPDLGADNVETTQKQVFRKKDQKPWDQELQDKLEVVVSDNAAPVAKSEEWRRTVGGDNLQMRKNLKFASDPVWGIQTSMTGALHQNTPVVVVRDDHQESKEERRFTASKEELGVSPGAGDLDERRIGELGLHSSGVETEAWSTGAKAFSDSVQQKVVEHQKVLVVSRDLPPYVGLAIVLATIFFLIVMVCIAHRVSTARRKINFEGMVVDGESVSAANSPEPAAASTYLRTPTLATSKTSGYQELSETRRALESESRLQGWQGAVSDAAALVTPFGSKVTPRVRNEYKKK